MMVENIIYKIFSKNNNFLKGSFLNSFLDVLENLKEKEKIIIGLSGGNSLKEFYEELKNNFHHIDSDIRDKIYFCLIDERIVDFKDDLSNYKLVKNLFLDELIQNGLIKQKNILLPDFSLDNYEISYSNKVKKIDIGLFGVGEDGHIGSLFPNHELLKNEDHTYLKIIDSPKPPAKRITISKNMIKDIQYGFIFFMGDSKKQALSEFLDENISYIDCPAKLLLGCKQTLLYSDNS